MPKVSVIIPVYNVESYLRQCLDSVVNQTLGDIEIICVDDCSTDGSLAILREYADKDRRVRVIANKINLHAGVCRNLGMEIASGTYLVFLDADDVFEAAMLEKMAAGMAAASGDICLCAADSFDTNTGVRTPMPWLLSAKKLPRKKVFSRVDCASVFSITSPAPWNKMFSRSFIEKRNLKFQDILRTNDLCFTMSALCLAERIVAVPDVLVHYRKGMPNSLQSRNCDTPALFAEALCALKERLVSEGIYDSVAVSFANLALNVAVYNLKTLRASAWSIACKKLFDAHSGLIEVDKHPRDAYDLPENLDYIAMAKAALGGPLVSIVVPVYNVEKYLGECLDSLLAQTYPNFEVICVDDGSSDSSPDILSGYAGLFAARNIGYVVRRKTNAGLGAARNTGLSLARGRYVYFLDSDDWITPTAILELCTLAEREALDEVLFSAKTFSDAQDMACDEVAKYDRYYAASPADCGITLSGFELVKRVSARRGLAVSCPLKFFRRGLWTENGLSFPEGVLHEDEAIAYIALCRAKRVQMVDKKYYRRRIRAGSITTSKDTHRQSAIGYLKGMVQLERFAEACDSQEVSTLIRRRAINLFQNAVRSLRVGDLDADLPTGPLLNMIDYLLNGGGSSRQSSPIASGPVGKGGVFSVREYCTRLRERTLKCLRDRGLAFTLKRILFGKQD